MLRLLLALGIVACVFSDARAEPPPKPDEADDEADDRTIQPLSQSTDGGANGSATATPEVGYRGVSPGGGNLPPHPPKLPLKKGPQRMTWSGFQVKEGVPTVFIETTGTPDYQVQESRGELVVTLKNTVVPIKNNRRPLRVGFFNTPIDRVETKEAGRSVKVTIHTKDKDAPAHKEHVEPAAGGFQMLVIELPPNPAQSK